MTLTDSEAAVEAAREAIEDLTLPIVDQPLSSHEIAVRVILAAERAALSEHLAVALFVKPKETIRALAEGLGIEFTTSTSLLHLREQVAAKITEGP